MDTIAPGVSQTRTPSRCRSARTTRGWPEGTAGVSMISGEPGSGAATHSRSVLFTRRPVATDRACRNGGSNGPDRSPGGSRPRTHAGSRSTKTTECAVNAITPASRRDGWGRIVTLPSGGGNLPAAASLSRSASRPLTSPALSPCLPCLPRLRSRVSRVSARVSPVSPRARGAPSRSAARSAVGRDPGDRLAQSQRVDLLGAFVSEHRLQVVRVPDHRVLEGHPVRPEHGPRLPGDLDRGPDVAHLAEADLLRRDLPGFLQPPQVQREELGPGQVGQHPGQLALGQLEAGDLAAELLPGRGVLDG